MFINKNKYLRLVKQVICLTIIFELILPAIGFCGHTYSNKFEMHDFSICQKSSKNISAAYSCNEHSHEKDHSDHNKCNSHNHSHKHDNDNNCAHYHCSCLGGYIGVINFALFKITLSEKPYFNDIIEDYNFTWVNFIYHPPIYQT